MNLVEFLTWLFSSGGSVMVASWILERIPAYVKMASAEGKKYIFWIVSIVISGGAYAILQYAPAETVAMIAPYFAFAAGTFAVIFLGTAFHQVDKTDIASREGK